MQSRLAVVFGSLLICLFAAEAQAQAGSRNGTSAKNSSGQTVKVQASADRRARAESTTGRAAQRTAAPAPARVDVDCW